MTDAQLYDLFYDYIDKTIPAIIIPSVGDIPTKMVLISDLLPDWKQMRGKKLFIDVLFEEWIKDSYGMTFYEEWSEK